MRKELDEARNAALAGKGMEREIERQMETKLEKEREKRIEHTKAMAVHRIAKRDLAKGWVAWHDGWFEQRRKERLMKSAGARIVLEATMDGVDLVAVGWKYKRATTLLHCHQRRSLHSRRP